MLSGWEKYINQKALGELLNIDRANTPRAIKKLEWAEYVKSIINSEDKHIKKLYLTKEGQSVILTIRGVLFTIRLTMLDGFTEAENNQLNYLLEKV